MAKPRDGYHDVFAQVPDDLWDCHVADAKRNERSATAHLIWILRQRYQPQPKAEDATSASVDEPARRPRKPADAAPAEGPAKKPRKRKKGE